MVEQPRLRGPVVVRGDSQDRVGAGLGAPLGEFHGSHRVVAAGPGDHVTVHGPGHGLHEGDLLVVGERRRLAGGAGQNQSVIALVDQPSSQLDSAVEV